jgi:hypothetical protein
MPKRVKRYGLALVGVGVGVGVIAPAVIAAAGDTDDFIQPASTVVQMSLKPGTRMRFVFQEGATTVPSGCNASSTSGRTPAHGLVMAVKPMSFTNCNNAIAGRDNYKTSGVWHVTFLDAANDEASTEPNSGDRLVITVPIKGMTDVENMNPTCTLTVAPTAPAHMVGAYNDANTLTITNAPVPISLTSTGSPGCIGGNGSSTAKFSATYVLTPGVHDAS